MTEEQRASTEPVSMEPASRELVSREPVLTEQASTEPSSREPAPQPLTEERIQQLIAEAQQKAIEQGKTIGRHEMQIIKDREVGEQKRRAAFAERKAMSYERGLGTLDAESRTQIEHERLKGENELYRTQEQEEEARRQQEIYIERLNQSLIEEVTSLGLDPSDKRIDFAPDAPTYFEGRKRFSESLAKIVKADKDSVEKNAITKAEERFRQLEAEFRKQHGLDSQDTTAPTGVVNQSEADFMADWGAYRLPDTKENRARYEEIKKKYY